MISPGVFVVAEISANHGGKLEKARELVREAAAAGADAVKFQTYTADTMTLDMNTPEFSVSPSHQLWGGRTLHSLYREAMTPWEWHRELFGLARALGVVPFSSPFDLTAVEFLENLGTTMYKIASLEIVDLPLIDAVSRTGKPVIISTGAASLQEVDEAVDTVFNTGNRDVTLLVCTSSYPASPSDAHLRRIQTLKERHSVRVGISDHTQGLGVSIAAVALGASVVERHLTLNRSDGGLDAEFSLEPEELTQLVSEIRDVEMALGAPEWVEIPEEAESKRLRRSLYVVEDVVAGDLVSTVNVRAIRPSHGLAPKYWWAISGSRFSQQVGRGTPLSFEMLDITALE